MSEKKKHKKIKLILIAAVFLVVVTSYLLLYPIFTLAAWYDSSWSNRFKITSDNTLVVNANDVLYYDLSLAPSTFWDTVNSDGSDIRVTQSDGLTEVAREISYFDSSGEIGALFFKADGLSTSSDTDFYIYYGNSGASEPSATATYGRNAVWNNFELVYNFGTSSTLDSTGNGYTLSLNGTPATTTGKVTSAMSFPTSSDWAETTTAPVGSEPYLACVWANPDAFTNSLNSFLVMEDNVSPVDRDATQFQSTANIRVFSQQTGQTNVIASSGVDGSIGSWSYVCTRLESDGTLEIFVDGQLGDTQDASAMNTRNFTQLTLARRAGAGGQSFQGDLSAVRVASTTTLFTDNYIKTAFNNETNNGTFWATGSEEQDSDAGGPGTSVGTVKTLIKGGTTIKGGVTFQVFFPFFQIFSPLTSFIIDSKMLASRTEFDF